MRGLDSRLVISMFLSKDSWLASIDGTVKAALNTVHAGGFIAMVQMNSEDRSGKISLADGS
jgi:hypothetical protein